MTQDWGGRRLLLGSPPSAPFPKEPGATCPQRGLLVCFPIDRWPCPTLSPTLARSLGQGTCRGRGCPQTGSYPFLPRGPGPRARGRRRDGGVPGQRGLSLPGPKYQHKGQKDTEKEREGESEREGYRDRNTEREAEKSRSQRKETEQRRKDTETQRGGERDSSRLTETLKGEGRNFGGRWICSFS